MQDDRLSDEDLNRSIQVIEKFELERLITETGQFVGEESWIGGELPRGYSWIKGEEWMIDHMDHEKGAVDQGLFIPFLRLKETN